ncbi:hypothetical protein HX021_18610 [Sphingobacterium sp. N143]|uniref:hypothetical protein n=1 Tax=Sphingobacterium sp. N143 TaxID=2746727 RepID=UPI002576FD35|nr:hypothetical protein [Sphingobacterium sp. N143]MDM1296301.1 hypothetical protein [Sphingobacterium sp. N143]
MKRILILFVAISVFGACSKDETSGREAERMELDRMKQEIKDRISQVPCDNQEEWVVMELGSKACGGPQEYIAYPTELDEEDIDDLIEEYTQKEKDFNKKYNIVSDCRAVAKPTGVTCEDGKPKLIFPQVN